MIVVKFDPWGFDEVKTTTDVFKAIGIGKGTNFEFTDKTVFGDKANYANLFVNNTMYDRARSYMEDNWKEKHTCPYLFEWSMYSPISTGPRYDKVCEKLGYEGGEIPDGVLVIVTPADDMYEKAPEV